MSDALRYYREVWLCDFEFGALPGERPTPRCMVAREWRSGRTMRLWADELAIGRPPLGVSADCLFVAYYASAELGCFRVLNWPMPARILDLFAEFRCLTNGIDLPSGNGLVGALQYFGIASIDAAEKDKYRKLALRGGEYSEKERKALLDYCESDVASLGNLLSAMIDKVDLPRALLRGRYMAAVSAMENVGTPIDVEALGHLRSNWNLIKDGLIRRIDADYEVYVGQSFHQGRFTHWLSINGIPWPTLPSGMLALDEGTFRDMARAYPIVAPLRELRHSLGEMRLFSDLAVGVDSRNRCLLSPFRSVTGRNQPSSARFIFGPSVWLRSLIKPPDGRAIAYVDWSQQEFGIAAALSGDGAMIDAYRSGDPYLTFAKQAGAVPLEATKASHGAEREQFKVAALAVQYGMGERSLAARLGKPLIDARELLRLHRQTYPRFWKWSQANVDHAMLRGWLQTVFGWRVNVGGEVNPRSLGNFPMQSNGAEMLRLACCLATEDGIEVCAPVHDAVLIEAAVDEIDDAVDRMQAAMAEASRVVLGGFALATDAKIVRWPDRYSDARGERFWSEVSALIEDASMYHRTTGFDRSVDKDVSGMKQELIHE